MPPEPWASPGPNLPFADYCQPLLAEVDVDPSQKASTCFLPFPSVLGEKSGFSGQLSAGTGIHIDTSGIAGGGANIVFTLPGDIVDHGFPGELDDPAVSRDRSAPFAIANGGNERVPYAATLYREGARPFIVLQPRSLGKILGPDRGTLDMFHVLAREVRLASGERAHRPEGFRRMVRQSGDACGICYRGEAKSSRGWTPADCAGCADDDRRLQKARAELDYAFEWARIAKESDPQLLWSYNARQPRPPSFGSGSLPVGQTPTSITSVESRAGHRVIRGLFGTARIGGQPDEALQNVEFTAIVPESVDVPGKIGRALLYGPPTFGSRAEVEAPAAVGLAKNLDAVLFSIDWLGTSAADVDTLTHRLANYPFDLAPIQREWEQSIRNWNQLAIQVVTELTKAPELTRDGKPIYDPKLVAFVGTGHFLDGLVPAGTFRQIHRYAFLGGGGGLGSFFESSTALAPVREALRKAAGEPMLAHGLFSMVASALAEVDPLGTAVEGIDARGPILVQAAIGDTEVPNVATSLYTQAVRAKQTMPSSYVDKLLEEVGPPRDSSGKAVPPNAFVTYYDFGTRLPRGAYPATSNGTHARLLTTASAIRQLDAFLRPDGVVIHPCEGPCDPD